MCTVNIRLINFIFVVVLLFLFSFYLSFIIANFLVWCHIIASENNRSTLTHTHSAVTTVYHIVCCRCLARWQCGSVESMHICIYNVFSALKSLTYGNSATPKMSQPNKKQRGKNKEKEHNHFYSQPASLTLWVESYSHTGALVHKLNAIFVVQCKISTSNYL